MPVEKRSVVVPETSGAKSGFFREDGAAEPSLGVCAKALEDPETVKRISDAPDGCSIPDSPGVMLWWRQFLPSQDKPAASRS